MIYAPTVILTVHSDNIADSQADRRRCAFVFQAKPSRFIALNAGNPDFWA
jgi:hypothetical protein